MFSTNSAYSYLSPTELDYPPILYGRRFGSGKVLRDYSLLCGLWLRLLTNQLRWIRGMAENPVCAICGFGVEDSLYLPRDCADARATWISWIPPNYSSQFFNLSLSEWILSNISDDSTHPLLLRSFDF